MEKCKFTLEPEWVWKHKPNSLPDYTLIQYLQKGFWEPSHTENTERLSEKVTKTSMDPRTVFDCVLSKGCGVWGTLPKIQVTSSYHAWRQAGDKLEGKTACATDLGSKILGPPPWFYAKWTMDTADTVHLDIPSSSQFLFRNFRNIIYLTWSQLGDSGMFSETQYSICWTLCSWRLFSVEDRHWQDNLTEDDLQVDSDVINGSVCPLANWSSLHFYYQEVFFARCVQRTHYTLHDW